MKPWQRTRDEYLRHTYMLSHRLVHKGCVPKSLGSGYSLPLGFEVLPLESIAREQDRIELFLRFRKEYWDRVAAFDRPHLVGTFSVSADITYACNRSGCFETTIVSIYRAHEHHCAEAVKRGHVLPDAVLQEYPGLRNWKPERIYMQLIVVENALKRPFLLGLQGGRL